MNTRPVICSLWGIACVAALWGVATQRVQLASLRAEQRQLQAQSGRTETVNRLLSKANVPGPSSEPATRHPVSLELLRLRGQVAPLKARLRELAPLRMENEMLRTQAASHATNASPFLYSFQARLVGYGRPADTLQSFQWAVEHRDLTNLLQAFVPVRAQQISDGIQQYRGAAESYFQFNEGFLGMGIVTLTPVAQDEVVALVQTSPDHDPRPVRFKRVEGDWKIDENYLNLLR